LWVRVRKGVRDSRTGEWERRRNEKGEMRASGRGRREGDWGKGDGSGPDQVREEIDALIVKDVIYNVAIKKHLMFSKTTFLPICVGQLRLSVATGRFFVASDRRKIAVGQMIENRSVSVRWESVK